MANIIADKHLNRVCVYVCVSLCARVYVCDITTCKKDGELMVDNTADDRVDGACAYLCVRFFAFALASLRACVLHDLLQYSPLVGKGTNPFTDRPGPAAAYI